MSEDRSVFELMASPSLEVISYGEDDDQIIEVFKSQSSTSRKVLLIHGGYWRPEYDRSHLRPYAARFAELGFEIYLMEYRREQGKPQQYLADVEAAIELVGNCSVVGHSAGGHLALLVHKNKRVEQVIALAPVSDLVVGEILGLDNGAITEFLGGEASEFEELDPARQSTHANNVLIIHGDTDERVPVELSRSFREQFPDTRYVELSGVGHFEMIDPRREEILAEVIRALR